ncbi:Amyloid beta A4 precursor protein-binding family B member 1-interacting protein [Larimichthys crocea]|uniref:Uncharacterized protein n=1 Tax=Larimichthys crocea TaxID=215358 RepID=A0ACD3QPI0_LARCR|nr:Amyloid beta A4 precursor protein-binding family B member 1-interacting protein [Larimichthys crocea]
MDDIDAMFSDLLGEMDLLTQSLGQETVPPASPPSTNKEVNFSIGFTDQNESLNELEDTDLDALMADLVADLNATEEKLAAEIQGLKVPSPPPSDLPPPPTDLSTHPASSYASPTSPASSTGSSVSTPASSATSPIPPPQSSKPTKEEIEAQMKADKIKLALEKLKEAKVKKLVVKFLLNDGSAKTLMVDERQTVREVLDNLFEKTHCDCNVDWSLCETNHELQLERTFEDHENLVEPLLAWTRDSENKILFQERREKNEVFKNPQNFYLWKKDKKALKDIKDKDKELLVQENFCGTSIIVPDLEAVLHLKEDGKKSWKQRLFQLRASGIYYVPKGKTKSSRDLVCFVQFDNLNVYYGKDFKSKYKAPTDFCFVLKHPQIQKESQYIKYLCCDDARTMNLWVTGIRIAKYGVSLYENFKTSEKKAAVSSVWTNRSTPSSSNPSTPSPTIKAKSPNQANGHAPTPQPGPISADFGNIPPPPPPMAEILPPPPPDPAFPPPPSLPSKGSPKPSLPQRKLPTNFPPPPPSMDNLPPPPPPPPIDDAPPDFLPPPPPTSGFGSLPPPPPPMSSLPLPPPPASFGRMDQSLPPPPPDPEFLPPPPPEPVFTGGGGGPPPPPPPPPPPAAGGGGGFPRPALRPVGSVKKMPPAPPKRTTPSLQGGGGDGDLMSELMLAMNKKRGAH